MANFPINDNVQHIQPLPLTKFLGCTVKALAVGDSAFGNMPNKGTLPGEPTHRYFIE